MRQTGDPANGTRAPPTRLALHNVRLSREGSQRRIQSVWAPLHHYNLETSGQLRSRNNMLQKWGWQPKVCIAHQTAKGRAPRSDETPATKRHAGLSHIMRPQLGAVLVVLEPRPRRARAVPALTKRLRVAPQTKTFRGGPISMSVNDATRLKYCGEDPKAPQNRLAKAHQKRVRPAQVFASLGCCKNILSRHTRTLPHLRRLHLRINKLAVCCRGTHFN